MNHESRITLGIDIGGNKTAVVLWDGKIQKRAYEPYPENVKNNYEAWFEWLEKFLKEFLGDQNISAAGIAVAGIVSGGIVSKSPNLPILNGGDILQRIGESLGARIEAENDVSAFLRAEGTIGAARGIKNIVGVTLGTGVGGAIMINGELYEGEHGSAGEIGHMLLEGEATFEKLVSAKGFRRLTNTDPKELEDKARQGDREAQEIHNEVGKYLGRGLGNLINILDPEAIIIGGGIAHAFDLMEKSMQKEMEKVILSPEAKKVKVLPAKLGRYASAVGAALLAQES